MSEVMSFLKVFVAGGDILKILEMYLIFLLLLVRGFYEDFHLSLLIEFHNVINIINLQYILV